MENNTKTIQKHRFPMENHNKSFKNIDFLWKTIKTHSKTLISCGKQLKTIEKH